MVLSYIIPEEVNITNSRIVVLREVISPKPGGVEEDKDNCKEDLKHILHHEHAVEETRVSEIMKKEREIPKLNPQPDSSADLLSLPLPGDLVRGEGSAVEVLGHVRVLPQKCLLHHRLVETLQLLVHPREEEQGHLLQQDQDDYLNQVGRQLLVRLHPPRAS